MQKAEQGTRAMRMGGRRVPPLTGPLFLVNVAQLVERFSCRRFEPSHPRTAAHKPDRAVLCSGAGERNRQDLTPTFPRSDAGPSRGKWMGMTPSKLVRASSEPAMPLQGRETGRAPRSAAGTCSNDAPPRGACADLVSTLPGVCSTPAILPSDRGEISGPSSSSLLGRPCRFCDRRSFFWSLKNDDAVHVRRLP